MVETVKQTLPDAVVSATYFKIGRWVNPTELSALNREGIEVSAPIVDYVGFMLEAEYTYYFQGVHSCESQ